MSNPSERFECRWHASRRLLAVAAAAHGLALIACLMLALPGALKLAALAGCLLHGVLVFPRQVTLNHRTAVSGLRRDRSGWQLLTAAGGWESVQLRPDSVALPGLVILRFRRRGHWISRSACIPSDAMPADEHRRLRVCLKFSRRRWAPVAPQPSREGGV